MKRASDCRRRAESWVLCAWEGFFRRGRPLAERGLVVGIIFAITFTLCATLERHFQISGVIVVAAMLMCLYGGGWLGVTATVLLGLAVDLLFVPPVGSLLVTSEERTAFLVTLLLALVIGLLSASLRFGVLRLDRAVRARSEAESAKRTAEEACRARDELVGVISHELKNPLTALLTGISLVERKLPKTPENEEPHRLVGRLRPPVARMERLVTDLLDITQIEANSLRVSAKEEDVSAIAGEVLTELGPAAREKNVRLVLSAGAPGERKALCDARRTAQVISKLLSNAIKFSREGGEVAITVRREDGVVVTEVEDQGKGIPVDSLPRIFDRFWQAKDSAFDGTGLGLSIARGLVELQGGRVAVESEVGAGTKIRFTLPAA